MKKYVIITDSTSDLPHDIVEEMDIKVIPMTFEIARNSYMNYPDNRELDPHDFYNMLRNGETAVTSLINSMTFIDWFEPIVKEGADILYVAFSSAMSGTYNASKAAAEMVMEKYRDSRIICVDSKSASMGEGLLVYSAALQRDKGMSIDELHQWLLENRLHLCHWVTVDDLNHLKKGGRVNPLTATIGTALNMKPIIHVDDDGSLVPVSNVRGRKKSIHTLVDRMAETAVNPQDQVIFIGHGDNFEDAMLMEKLARDRLNVKDVVIGTMGPVIGSHAGPGTLTLFFFGTKR